MTKATNTVKNIAAKANPVVVEKTLKANAKAFAKPVNDPIAEAFTAQAETLINDAVKAFDKAGKKGLELVNAWLTAGMYTEQISRLCEGNTKKVNALIKGTKLEDVSRQDRNDAAFLYLNEDALMEGIKSGDIKAGGANYMRKQLKKLQEPKAPESDDSQGEEEEATQESNTPVTAESLAAYVVEQMTKAGITLVDFEDALMEAIK